jgi:hypothetical protein
MPGKHNVWAVLAAASLAAVTAACGSSDKPHGTAGVGPSPQGIKYSDCMRSHGVLDFPDLNANGSVSLPSSINPQAPAFQAAQQTCASLRPEGSPPAPITLAQQKSFLANARCIRTHGVPNFPDPAFGPGGYGIGYNVPPGSLAYEAQAILQASRECRNVGSGLPLRDLTQGPP